jgi:hypothetical protein
MDKFSELLAYDPSSKTGIRWIKPRQKIQVGSEAGSVSIRKDGCSYWFVTINLKTYRAHRVVWELVNGTIPHGSEIDHIDGNGLNNRIENLRLVTRAGNQRNVTKRADCSSDFRGIRYRVDRDCYTAQCYKLDGTRISKTFGAEVAKD